MVASVPSRDRADRRERHLVRRAHEVGDEPARGAQVELGRPAGLQDAPGLEHGHAIRHGEGFLDVVGDEHRGDAETALQLADLAAHLLAQAGVEIAERLVEQQQVRTDHERAGKRDALLLAARELVGVALGQGAETHELERLPPTPADLLSREPAHPEPEGDILEHREVRKERVVLEHERHVARVDGRFCDIDAAQADPSPVRRINPGDHAQDRGLAAAGGPEEGEELAAPDREVDAGHRAHVAKMLLEALDLKGHDAVGREVDRQGSLTSLRAPPSPIEGGGSGRALSQTSTRARTRR